MWAQPVTLSGTHAALVPLSQEHAAGLAQASADGDLSSLWYTPVPDAAEMEAEIDRRLGLLEKGTMVPFTVMAPDGRPVGMTTYMNIDHVNQRVEIGSTWYAKSVQRSGVNTECKRMLLGHAFDTLGAIAVEFRTHFLNRQSRAAIERLGARLDGILRSHMVMPNGTLRDTAVYSITAADWPAIRAGLNWTLSRPR
ncbi:GNAT family N-acetyltransferase [Arenibacterium halophilum]|uniref:GNAT family N-acetyltransferase n=1 Tax=Arenibacterium halophilum TaxID=2583821 RepID=A0ABY2XE82_9RHOB|nr:GNAT family protein [Arenibacterium halophilum]TMV15336.1 GNAT family N-acetyltransferase [Arenibacterium halophilum]